MAEDLSKKRTEILKEVLKKDEKKKSDERVKILREALEKGRGAKEAPPLDSNKNRALREKLGISKKEAPVNKLEGGEEKDAVKSEIRKNLEATEADWEKMEEDLDWMAREEEAKRILGIEGLEKIERLRQEAAEEIETGAPKAEPKELEEKVIVEEMEDEKAPEKKEEAEGKNKELEFEKEEKKPGEGEERRFKVGDMVRASDVGGKPKFWRVDGYDEYGRVKISRKRFLRKPEKQLIPEKVLRALNKK